MVVLGGLKFLMSQVPLYRVFTVYGVWRMVYGVWSMVYGVSSMVYGVWCREGDLPHDRRKRGANQTLLRHPLSLNLTEVPLLL